MSIIIEDLPSRWDAARRLSEFPVLATHGADDEVRKQNEGALTLRTTP